MNNWDVERGVDAAVADDDSDDDGGDGASDASVRALRKGLLLPSPWVVLVVAAAVVVAEVLLW